MSNPTPITVNENKASSKYIDRNPPLASDPDLNRKVVDYLAYLKEILNFSVATTGKRITDTSGYVNELVRTSNSLISTIYDTQNGLVSKVEQNSNSISLVVDSTTSTINAASIVAAINDAGSTVKISADHVDITGFVTFSDLSNDSSTTIINGANIRTGTISADRIGAGTITSSKLDSAVTQSISDAADAASAAQTTANGANGREQLIYISKASGTTSVSANTTWVTSSTDSQNAWRTKRPTYNSSYPVLFVATQRQTVAQMANSGTTCSCTTPVKDDTTTVIDGGHITTGTIDASQVNVTNINGANITANTLTLTALTSAAQGSLLTSTSVKTQYYLSTSNSSATGGSWSDTVPTWSSGKYVWTRIRTTKTYASGTSTDSDSTAVYDSNLTSALSTAASASTTANGNVASVEPLYYRKTTSGAPSKPSSQVTSTSDTSNAWTLTMPRPTNGCTFYTCQQLKSAGGTYSWSSVQQIANATYTSKWCNTTDSTYIDGSKIYTGTLTADKIAANETFTQKLYAQDFNITGGSINITTSDDSYDVIDLKCTGSSHTFRTQIKPNLFKISDTYSGSPASVSSLIYSDGRLIIGWNNTTTESNSVYVYPDEIVRYHNTSTVQSANPFRLNDSALTFENDSYAVTAKYPATLTASRALMTNSSKEVTASSVTATELGYVHGVTSAIQTQLNNKQASLSTSSGTLTFASGWTKVDGETDTSVLRYTHCRKYGKVVELAVSANTSSSHSNWNTVCTIPSGYRPSHPFTALGYSNDNDSNAIFRVNTAGEVMVYGDKRQPTLHVSYVLD